MKFFATRLAPSPTGALHLGHARTFLVTWWMARQAGAKIYMRMEDLDAGRAKPESVAQAYEDLRWLGMDWDEWPAASGQRSGEGGAVVQSERMAIYESVMETLLQRGVAYPCTCTRADIAAVVAASASAPHESDAMPRYPGTCRDRYPAKGSLNLTLDAVFNTAGREPCLRMRVPEGLKQVDDALAGPQSFDVFGEAGDFPITRFATASHVPPAYQLACVVDDYAMGIDMVIRGDDLLASTPRQILLYEAMEWAVPRFGHVPLVIGTDGKRLAKRHGESRIAQFRAAGVSAQRVVGWAAWRAGQLDKPREISATEVVKRFDVAKLPRDRAVLGAEDLAWLR